MKKLIFLSMKLKALCNHTLLILCSVLFLSLSVRVNAQKTGNDNVNPTHSTILKQSAATQVSDTLPDVGLFTSYSHQCKVGFGANIGYSVDVYGADMDQFHVPSSGIGGTCDALGNGYVDVNFSPTRLGKSTISIKVLQNGQPDDQAVVFNIVATGIYPSLVVSDHDSNVPEEKTYHDVSLTLNLIDLTKYHFISIPFTPTSVELKDFSDKKYDSSKYQIFRYRTLNRALNGDTSIGNNWEAIDADQMQPGIGYIIGFDDSMFLGAKITFKSAAEFDVERTGIISLTDYAIGENNILHKNWYLVGSQTFDDYQLSGAGLLNAQKYNINTGDYDLVNLATANSFERYSSVFVQYSGDLTSSVTMNPFRAPIQQNILSGQDNYLLSLANGTYAKQISIVTAPDGDDTYQIGKDLLMMGSMTHSELALAVDHTSGNLVADYISNNTQTLPLVTKLTVGTPYTFSLNYSQSHAQHVYLLDNETGDQTDLLLSDYSFVGSANAINRFSLNVILSKMPTSDELEKLEHLTFVSGKNSLLIAGLTKNYSIHIFDVTGKQVAQVENMEEDFEVSNLESGVYIVEYTNGTEKGTEKVMIK